MPQRETTPQDMDRALARLVEHKDAWMRSDFDERLRLLETLRSATDANASRWVDAAAEAKGLVGSPLVGEEWTSGPWALMEGIQHLTGTLATLRDGGDPLQGARVRTRPDGQVVVQVHPANHWERLLISGVEADVWMQKDVTTSNLRETMATHYAGHRPSEGRVAVVLGAGNIASIPPLDLLYKLFAEGQVCLLKMNPVNDYLGPVFEDIFAAFVEAGYVAFAYGGAAVGRYLTEHDSVDELHITGSERTHDAIIFGVGEDGERRKAKDEPVNPRPMTSELGGISPVIVVPGPWSAADIAFQAENVVTQKMHNGGFNCIASQVLVMPEGWDQGEAFIAALRSTFAKVPPRKPYYPGADDRIAAVMREHPDALVLDADAETPRVLVTDVDASTDDYCFGTEFFAGALAQTSLPAADAKTFIRNAIDFANERLRGTLGATILIHPKTQRELGPAFEDLLAELRYGTIGVNAWSGVNFLLPRGTWGAYPGHVRNDIQSGVGVVHNALMFEKPEKTVVSAPWRPFPRGVLSGQTTLLPRPPWFVTNAMAHEVGKRITAFAADPGWGRIPGIFMAALRG